MNGLEKNDDWHEAKLCTITCNYCPTKTYLYSKHFLTGVKNHIAIAKLWIDKHILLPDKTENDLVKNKIELKLHFTLGCKCSSCLEIYVHDRKGERKKLTFRLLAVIPSLCTSSSSSSFSKYGRRLNARSSSQTSIGEKVVRCRFFVAECSVGVEVWSGSLSQSLLELVMSE